MLPNRMSRLSRMALRKEAFGRMIRRQILSVSPDLEANLALNVLNMYYT